MRELITTREVRQIDDTVIEVVESAHGSLLFPKHIVIKKDGEEILSMDGHEWDHLVRG